MPTFAPRLHIIVAQKSPVAVVFRRGPSKKVCTILWDLKKNKFETGQWLKGRIYERRSHISPDGRYMIYFAMNGRWNSETQGSWTAISKTPNLKALTLYAKGDCWNGGGLFLDNENYLLNEKYKDHKLLRDDSKLTALRGVPKDVPYGNNECLGIYYSRLQTEGWKLNEDLSDSFMQVFDKPWKKTVILRKLAHIGPQKNAGQSVYWDSHALVNAKGTILDCPDWDWADVIDDNLSWTQAGRLYQLTSSNAVDLENPLDKAVMLKDFGLMQYEELIAPY